MREQSRIEWNQCRLGDLFRLHREAVNPTSHPRETFEHYSIPAFDETGGPVAEAGKSIESNKTLLSKPTILVSKLNPRKPRVILVDDKSTLRRCASTEWMPYIALSGDINLNFYKWLLGSQHFQSRLERVATGSTNSHVRARPSETLKWTVPVPPLPEQHRIAEILDTLDEAIRKTEQVIAKLQQMKQGLLHDLLTRGIDENGELRDPERHPERFKDSPLGRIPTEWEVVLGERLFSLHSGTAPAELREDGGGAALYLKVDDFNHPANQYGLNVAELTFGPRPGGSGVFSPGAIVFPKRGAAIFQNRVQILLRPVTVDPNLMVLHPLNVDAQFLQNYLIHFNLSNICDNSGLPQINNKHIYPLLFAVPDISEQRRVIASLDSLAARLRQEKVESMKLRTLKHGLMDDLLTGRVRVPIPEEATA